MKRAKSKKVGEGECVNYFKLYNRGLKEEEVCNRERE